MSRKEIYSPQWIFNKEASINTKVNNFNWKDIYARRGKKPEFSGKFYLTKKLVELLKEPLEECGVKVIE